MKKSNFTLFPILLITFVSSFSMSAPFCRDLVESSPISAKHAIEKNLDLSQRDYFKKIVEKGKDATLDELMVLWTPDTNLSDKSTADVVGSESTVVDTVYSWGSLAKLETLKNTLPNNKLWLEGDNINPQAQYANGSVYLAFSAVGSFGYGEVPVRFKLKPGVTAGQLGYSDFMVELGRMRQGVIRSGALVESWSFGTAEHYNEIVRDYLRYRSGLEWQGMAKEVGPFDLPWDGKNFAPEALRDHLLIMARMILNNEGQVFYNNGTDQSREKHFSTVRPTYINPSKK